MYWRHEYVREAISMTLGGTYKLDLPQHGQLCSLFLRITGSMIADSMIAVADWRIIDDISKISILGDGATVIKSLTGYQVQGLSYFDQGKFPKGRWSNYAAASVNEHMLINFGRFLYDPEFGLNLERFNNVELQIENTATAGALTDWADLTVSVLAVYKEEGGVYPGYFRTEEWRAWTTVVDETRYNDLPLEGRLRRVLLQAIPGIDSAEVEETNMSNLMDDIEFMLDTGRTRVYKGGIDDIMRLNDVEMGIPQIVGASIYHTADQGVDVSLGYVHGRAFGSGSQDGAGSATIPTLEGDRTSFTQKPETKEADSPIQALFLGIAPFMCLRVPFADQWDPASYLDLRSRATVALNIHTRNNASADNGRNAIVLDRLIT
jgi:hypothetical protein